MSQFENGFLHLLIQWQIILYSKGVVFNTLCIRLRLSWILAQYSYPHHFSGNNNCFKKKASSLSDMWNTNPQTLKNTIVECITKRFQTFSVIKFITILSHSAIAFRFERNKAIDEKNLVKKIYNVPTQPNSNFLNKKMKFTKNKRLFISFFFQNCYLQIHVNGGIMLLNIIFNLSK